MGFIIFLPFIAAIIGIIIAFIKFIGVCMLVIGITGIAMNKIYIRKMKTENCVSKPVLNVSSIILGLICILLPSGYILYEIIRSLFL